MGRAGAGSGERQRRQAAGCNTRLPPLLGNRLPWLPVLLLAGGSTNGPAWQVPLRLNRLVANAVPALPALPQVDDELEGLGLDDEVEYQRFLEVGPACSGCVLSVVGACQGSMSACPLRRLTALAG